MKRLLTVLLVGSATIDIAQQAYRIDLLGSIEKRGAGTGLFQALAASPIVTTIEHWALFLLGFGVLALAMSVKRPVGPGSLPPRR